MKATTAFGKVGNFPVRGTVVNIESGDVASIVNAATSAIKFLVTIGAIAAGVAIASAVYQKREMEEDSRIPLGSLARTISPGKSFIGVCLDNTLDFTHEGQPFSIELSRLRRIETCRARWKPLHYDVTLIDGSKYCEIIPTTKHLSVFSVAGTQQVLLPYEINWPLMLTALFPPLVPVAIVYKAYKKRAPQSLTICGVIPRDIDDLKRRLKYAVKNTRESVIKKIGEDVFSHFFT